MHTCMKENRAIHVNIEEYNQTHPNPFPPVGCGGGGMEKGKKYLVTTKLVQWSLYNMDTLRIEKSILISEVH